MQTPPGLAVHDPRPLYQQIADRLRDELIVAGAGGARRLPSEAELRSRWGVSRVTVRKALAVLQREGLVHSEQGRGTFTRASRIQIVLGSLETLDASVTKQGLAPTFRVLDFRFVAPPPEVRQSLQLAADETTVLELRRLHSVGGQPSALVSAFVPEWLGAAIARRDVEEQRLYELIPRRFGIQIGQATQRIRAATADDEVARLLDARAGDALLVCDRVVFDEDARPLFNSVFVLRGDNFEFRVRLPRAPRQDVWAPPGVALAEQPERALVDGPGGLP